MDVVVAHIKHFNRLNKNRISKQKLQEFYDKVKACNHPDLKEVEQRLKFALSKITTSHQLLHVTPIDFKKFKSKPVVHVPEKKSIPTRVIGTPKTSVARTVVPVVYPGDQPKKSISLSGVVGAESLKKISFKKIDLAGQYKTDFVRMFRDTLMLIWGLPGNGKTVYLLKFAKWLAIKANLNVLYIANEEWGRSTFTEKINDFDIGANKLFFSGSLPSNIEPYDVIFFDSIQSIGMTLERFKAFAAANKGKVLVMIVQSTKDGDFRGGKDWEHEVDIAGEIKNRKLILRKNRLDPEAHAKAEKLRMAEMVEDKKRSRMVKQTVDKQMNKDNKPAGDGTI